MSVLVDHFSGERTLTLRVAAAARACASPGPGRVYRAVRRPLRSGQPGPWEPAGTIGCSKRPGCAGRGPSVITLSPQPSLPGPRGPLCGRRSSARRTAVASGQLCRTLLKLVAYSGLGRTHSRFLD